MQFITRPLIDWPRPATKNRTNGPYRVGYAKTLDDMERELGHLRVTGDVMIQLDMPEGDIRRDGLPYSDKRPRSPRVAIAFTGKYGPMVYRCDVHNDWQQNLRAIVLGMHRLRLVADTGITSQGEQYSGFRALPPGIPMPAAMTVEDAARAIATLAAPLIEGITDPMLKMQARTYGAAGALNSAEVFQAMYRLAAKTYHHDAGGDANKWKQLQAAADVLKRHHKIA